MDTLFNIVAAGLMAYAAFDWLRRHTFSAEQALALVGLIGTGLTIPRFAGSILSFLSYCLLGSITGGIIWSIYSRQFILANLITNPATTAQYLLRSIRAHAVKLLLSLSLVLIALLAVTVNYFRVTRYYQPLTTQGQNYQPFISQNGDKVVFISTRDGNPEVYIMNSDGSQQERLTFTPTIEEDLPSFAPRDELIIFSGYDGTSDDLYTLSLSDKQQTKLTDTPEHNERHARFTAGDFTRLRIIFTADYDKSNNNREIYVANYRAQQLDGNIDLLVHRPEFDDFLPSYIPQTNSVLFRSTKLGGGVSKLYLTKLNDNETVLLSSDDEDFFPVATSSDNWIVFVSTRNQKHDIYAMNIISRNVTQLTDRFGEDSTPAVSPDGGWLYYAWRKNNNESFQIYRMPLQLIAIGPYSIMALR